MSNSIRHSNDLALCPWCGGPADIEEIGGEKGAPVSFSVGCHDGDGKAVCFGYQSLTSFARKSEAIAAWNRRPAPPDQAQAREAAERIVGEVDAAAARGRQSFWQDDAVTVARALLTSPVPAQEDVTGDELAELADYAVSMFMAASAEASAYDADQFTKRGHEALALIRTGNPAAIRAALAKLMEGKTDGQ